MIGPLGREERYPLLHSHNFDQSIQVLLTFFRTQVHHRPKFKVGPWVKSRALWRYFYRFT